MGVVCMYPLIDTGIYDGVFGGCQCILYIELHSVQFRPITSSNDAAGTELM